MEIKSEEMRGVANSIDGLISQWTDGVNTLYQYLNDLKDMWIGDASDAFAEAFKNDEPKFNQLKEMMETYKEAINTAAQRYDEGEANIKTIVTRQ